MSCHDAGGQRLTKAERGRTTIALAGNANVGKSVIFNQLTGSHQTIGNWPGKTVERAQGSLHFDGLEATIVDLPGIYSMSTFSQEEIVSREYIAHEKPDVVINVIGAPVLERNLYFTLQLLEMGVPMVVCLNQMDIARSKGITIDVGRLQEMLGVPVVPTVAARGKGIQQLIEKAAEIAGEGCPSKESNLRYGNELEPAIEKVKEAVEADHVDNGYPSRWLAIKLLEDDSVVRDMVAEKSAPAVQAADIAAKELEDTYEEPCYAVVTSNRYALASRIASEVQSKREMQPSFSDRLDRLTTHKFFGYVVCLVLVTGLLLWTFTVGNLLSGMLTRAFAFFKPVDLQLGGSLGSVVWNGVFGGLVAGVTLVIPYVAPFYLMLAMMEDSGILTRVAFVMDSAMHQMGLHGKAIIPLILGYGCNVPAIYGTRIMETRRERLLASFAITFAPCTARTIVILGLVAVFVGTPWALALYALDLLIMFLLLKAAVRVVPSHLTGLVMEIHSFKVPSFSVVTRQTWARTKSLIFLVFPMYMVGGAVVQGLYALGILGPIDRVLSPLTVYWLGLPAIVGMMLVFGIVRKELILLTLVAVYGVNLASYLTPVQLVVLALVGTLYIPCLATIGVLAKEFGWKAAGVISLANLVSALVAGGILARLLGFVL